MQHSARSALADGYHPPPRLPTSLAFGRAARKASGAAGVMRALFFSIEIYESGVVSPERLDSHDEPPRAMGAGGAIGMIHRR